LPPQIQREPTPNAMAVFALEALAGESFRASLAGSEVRSFVRVRLHLRLTEDMPSNLLVTLLTSNASNVYSKSVIKGFLAT